MGFRDMVSVTLCAQRIGRNQSLIGPLRIIEHAGSEQCSRADETRRRALMTSAVSLIRPLAGFCGGLAVLSIFWPDWIETLTGYDPDQHNATVEWLIVIALLSTAPYWRSRRRAPNGASLDDV
jgi:hypothetical protein